MGSAVEGLTLWDGDVMERALVGQRYLEELETTGRFFYRRVNGGVAGAEVEVISRHDGSRRQMLCFASNDYLNLSRHPKVVEAAVEAARRYGVGAGSAPILSGTLDIHLELERRTAQFKSCEDAIVYSSGYAANLGGLLAVLGSRDCAILDMRVHASLIQGCKGTNVLWFRHNDVGSLERRLKIARGRDYATLMVVVDGVYSMDGDLSPVAEICEIAHRYGAYLWLDDAHGTGVLGENGRGTAEHFGVDGKVDLISGSYSKALGCAGGFVAGRKQLITGLRFVSRPYVFSAGFSPSIAGAALAALEAVEEEPERRARLQDNSDYFRGALKEIGFDTGESQSPIVPVIVADEAKVVELCALLDEAAVFVNPIVYPAVPRRASRLRFSITSELTRRQLDRCLELMERFGRALGIVGTISGAAVTRGRRKATAVSD